MISLSPFSKSRKPVQSVDRTIGFDGYRQCDRAVICQFQQIIEREADCNYDALRAALRKAQDRNFVVTLVQLRKAYNDAMASMVQYA